MDRTCAISNQQKGRSGEKAARDLLWSWFRDIKVGERLSKDGGVDLVCSNWVSPPPGRTSEFRAWIQVKTGESFFHGVKIRLSTFGFWLDNIETQAALILHYPSAIEPGFPLYLLNVHEWTWENVPRVRGHFSAHTAVTIPHSAFKRLNTSQRVRDVLVSEQGRVTRSGHSKFRVRHDNIIREREYFLRFPEVARRMESRELSLRTDLDNLSIGHQVGVQHLHPLDRARPGQLDRAQRRLYTALKHDPLARGWHLGWRFNVWTVAAARAMAAKYEEFQLLALEVLRTWRQRSPTDVLISLQMIGTIGYFDRRAAARAKSYIHQMIRELTGTIRDFQHYRFAHHVLSTAGELFDDHTLSLKSVRVAAEYPWFEVMHLKRYGWGFGPQVVEFYDQAAARATLRAANTVEYNKSMASLMRDLLAGEDRRIIGVS